MRRMHHVAYEEIDQYYWFKKDFRRPLAKLHITQKLLVGFHPNLHQQTRRVLVHLFVYGIIIVQLQNEVP